MSVHRAGTKRDPTGYPRGQVLALGFSRAGWEVRDL